MSTSTNTGAVFKRPDYTQWNGQHQSSDTSAQTIESQVASPQKKKRPKSNIVYSQPADTGTGVNVNTQLVYAVNHLKSTPNPMRLQDIAIVTNTPLDSDRVLLEKFKAHDCIHWDPKMEQDFGGFAYTVCACG